MPKLSNQIAIITGSSSGIGAGVAKGMASEGATVIINHSSARSAGAARQVLNEILAAGGTGMVCQCDVSNEAEVQKMFADTIAKYGTVDILVNNAGLQQDASFTEMTLQQWNKVIGVNLTGQFLCAREAIKEFIRRGIKSNISLAAGKIICMSSVHQVIPWAGHANYAASKGGVNMLMQTLAQEFGPQKIRVNSIGPGAIKTPINHEAWETADAEKKLLELIPYGRVGVVDDIAKAAIWLASDDSDYVNGVTLFVDGGMTLYPGFADNG
jgi:glucose 1-dehydrogenase